MGISIAMCTYNGASYLKQQLGSIVAQSRLPDELIICDDGSTDATLDLLERFRASAPFATQVIRNPVNLGYTRNFAKAVALCSQGIIALSDQDDLWYPNKLAHLEQRFSFEPSIDGIFSDGDLMDSDSRPLGRMLWASFLFSADDQAQFNAGGAVEVLLQRNVVTGMAFAFRSSVKDLITSVPQSWIHDGWLAFLIAARHRLVADPEPLVAYRVHHAQKIGAPASLPDKLRWMRTNGVGSYLKVLREKNVDEYQRTALQFEELAEFLRHDPRPNEGALRAAVERKAAYARRGVAVLTSKRFKRWPMLASHLDDYEHFSPNALRMLSRDLLI